MMYIHSNNETDKRINNSLSNAAVIPAVRELELNSIHHHHHHHIYLFTIPELNTKYRN